MLTWINCFSILERRCTRRQGRLVNPEPFQDAEVSEALTCATEAGYTHVLNNQLHCAGDAGAAQTLPTTGADDGSSAAGICLSHTHDDWPTSAEYLTERSTYFASRQPHDGGGSAAGFDSPLRPPRGLTDHQLYLECPSHQGQALAKHRRMERLLPPNPLGPVPAAVAPWAAQKTGRRVTAPPEQVAAPAPSSRDPCPWDAHSAGLLGLSDPGGLAEVKVTLDNEASRRQLLQQHQTAVHMQQRMPNPDHAQRGHPRPHLPPLPSHPAPPLQQHPPQPQPPAQPPHAAHPPCLPPLQPLAPAARLPQPPAQPPHLPPPQPPQPLQPLQQQRVPLQPRHDPADANAGAGGAPAVQPCDEEEDEPELVIYDPDLDAEVANRTAAWVAAAASATHELELELQRPFEQPFEWAEPEELPWQGAATLHPHGPPPPGPASAAAAFAAAAAAAAQGAYSSCYSSSYATSSRPSTCPGVHPQPQPPPHSHRPVAYPPDPLFHGQPPQQWRVSGDSGVGAVAAAALAAAAAAARGGGGVRSGGEFRGSGSGARPVGVPGDPAAARFLQRGMLLSAALKMSKDQAAAKRGTAAAVAGAAAGVVGARQRSLQRAQSRQSRNDSARG